MRRRVADLVQCLTVSVVYPQYATTEDTKCAKEKKNILKYGRVLARLSVLRVYVRLVVVNRKHFAGGGCAACPRDDNLQ